MGPEELDLAAQRFIADAGFGRWDVYPPVTVALAHPALGEHGVVLVPGLPMNERMVVDDDGTMQIQLRASLEELYLQFACAHSCGHVAARLEGWDLEGEELERACDMFAAALWIPHAPFLEALGTFGEDWPELAVLFGTTETAVALRAGEVTGRPIAVVGPQTVRGRGEAQWTVDDLRAYRARIGPGLTAARLRDDPRRLVITPSDDEPKSGAG